MRTAGHVRIGARDRRVTFSRKIVTTDPNYGTEVITWADLPTIWAEVRDVLPSKAESVVQGLAVARNQVRIRFTYREDVDSSMRATVHDYHGAATVLQIVGGPAEIGGRKAFMEIMCERFSS